MEVSPITLTGRFVRLEALSTTHHDGLCRVVTNDDLWKSRVTSIPAPEEIGAWIDTELTGLQHGCELAFTIFWKETDEVVGNTRYCYIEAAHRKLEIRTWIDTKWQRTVVNTESKFLLLQHAFEVMKCIRVQFLADVLNDKSICALKRIGAKLEGLLRNHLIMRGGRYRDSFVFSIIDTDWPEVKPHLLKLLAADLEADATADCGSGGRHGPVSRERAG